MGTGYSSTRSTEVSGYTSIIARNRSIYDVINRHRDRQYPLTIWHEGNIPAEHQRCITSFELNADVRFIDVSSVFRLPHSIREDELVENWSVGYQLMCRFHSYYVWQYTKQFDYVMRLDEDCILQSSVGGPIETLAGAHWDFASPHVSQLKPIGRPIARSHNSCKTSPLLRSTAIGSTLTIRFSHTPICM